MRKLLPLLASGSPSHLHAIVHHPQTLSTHLISDCSGDQSCQKYWEGERWVVGGKGFILKCK